MSLEKGVGHILRQRPPGTSVVPGSLLSMWSMHGSHASTGSLQAEEHQIAYQGRSRGAAEPSLVVEALLELGVEADANSDGHIEGYTNWISTRRSNPSR